MLRDGRRPTAIGEPRDEAIEEQDGEDSGVGEWADDRGFYEPVVVDYAEGGAGIDEAMEGLPAFAAETADPARGRGERQRNEQQERGETHGDEAALQHVFPNFRHVEKLIENQPCTEVQASIKEGEEAEHAAKADEFG